MKDYSEILSKKDTTVLITGDSLSYNRYGYDTECRGDGNAYEYGVGMGSWSFALRDYIYRSDAQFVYGDELRFDCKRIKGIDNDSVVPNTAMFGGRVSTLYPETAVTLEVAVKGEEIVLYLQRRIQNHCIFDIYVDGVLAAKAVDTVGNMLDFAGYGLLIVRLKCDSARDKHTLKFANIKGESPKITVAGIGSVYKNIVMSGKGNQCTSFFIENFEERIARHRPDLILLSITANDRARVSLCQMNLDLTKLFNLIFNRFPECKVLLMLPPSSRNPQNPDSDESPYMSDAASEKYYLEAERLSLEFREKFDIDVMRISALFDNENPHLWRFDNVHLNRFGNEVLFKALADKLNIKGDNYGKLKL